MKRLLLIFLSYTLFYVFATSLKNGRFEKLSLNRQTVSKLFLPDDTSELQHWAATENEIISAPCKPLEDLSSEKIKSRIQIAIENRGGEKQTEQTFFEKKIQGRLLEFSLLRHMLVYGIDELKSTLPSACTTTDCVLEHFFQGHEETIPYLKILYFEYGLNASAFLNEWSSFWSLDELKDALFALDSIPKTLLPLRDLNQTFQRVRSKDPERKSGGTTLANATMSYFDSWSSYSSPYRRYTVVHEIGHNIQKNYELATVWEDLSKKWDVESEIQNGAIHSRVSKYAYENYSEDFAETFVSYRFSSKSLKEKNPKKYKFMKEIYDGIEYDDEKNCDKLTSSQEWFEKNYKESIQNYHFKILNINVIEDLFSYCTDEFSRHFSKSKDQWGEVDEITLCVLKSGYQETLQGLPYLKWRNLNSLYYLWNHNSKKNVNELIRKMIASEVIQMFKEREKIVFSILSNEWVQKKIETHGFCNFWADDLTKARLTFFKNINKRRAYVPDFSFENFNHNISRVGKDFCEEIYDSKNNQTRLDEKKFSLHLTEYFDELQKKAAL